MFSFILPSFNHIDLLRATLTSLVWQKDVKDFEVIVVDNNSSEENPDIIYQEFYDRLNLYLIKQPKLAHTYSLCKARNCAIRLAHYPWIVSLDADIVLNPKYLKNLKKAVEKEDRAILTAERIFIDSTQVKEITLKDPSWPEKQKVVISPANYNQSQDRRLSALKQLPHISHPWAYMHGCNVVYPRELAVEIGGYDEAFDGNWGYEDVDFAHRLISEKHVKPLYCPGIFCYHLENPKDEMNRFDKKNNPNWKRICEKIPGFKEYKEAEYHELSKDIQL